MWIDRHLADANLDAALRATLLKLRAKGLAGTLSLAEFRKVRAEARGEISPLRALLAALRGAERRAARVPPATLSSSVRADLDRVVDEVTHLVAPTKHIVARSTGR